MAHAKQDCRGIPYFIDKFLIISDKSLHKYLQAKRMWSNCCIEANRLALAGRLRNVVWGAWAWIRRGEGERERERLEGWNVEFCCEHQPIGRETMWAWVKYSASIHHTYARTHTCTRRMWTDHFFSIGKLNSSVTRKCVHVYGGNVPIGVWVVFSLSIAIFGFPAPIVMWWYGSKTTETCACAYACTTLPCSHTFCFTLVWVILCCHARMCRSLACAKFIRYSYLSYTRFILSVYRRSLAFPSSQV